VAAGTDYFDNHSSERLSRLGRQRREYVEPVLLQQFEGDGQVMTFQYRFVVVHQRQLRPCTTSATKVKKVQLGYIQR